ncbi:MAG: hypothetical protein PUB47_01505 [Bacteroides sp.]|nr:hypothetical protein [Bacteroides sp.]
MRRLLTIVCAGMILSSCGALRKQIETVYVRDTTYISKLQVDSVFKRDSIFVKEKNDTIYVYKEKVRDRYRLLRDTVYQHSVDSVYVDKVREVKVEKQLNAWQKFRLHGFWVLAAMVGGYVVWKYRKHLFRVLTKLVA